MSALQSSVAPRRAGDEGGDRTDPGGAGYEIAKEAVMCTTCAQEHLAKEAAQEADSLGI
jgi:hypothetical protein